MASVKDGQVRAKDFFRDIGKQYDCVFIGETHRNPGNGKIYWNPEFYEGLKKAGFKYLAIETDAQYQKLFDSVFSRGDKKSVREDFTATAYAGAILGFSMEQVLLARKYGIRIIAIDSHDYEKSDPDRENIGVKAMMIKTFLNAKGLGEDQIREKLPDADKNDPSVYAAVARNRLLQSDLLSEKEQDELYELNRQTDEAKRIRNADPAWLENLNKVVPQGAKLAAILGSGHFEGLLDSPGFDELMGGDGRVATIRIYENEKEKNQWDEKGRESRYAGLHESRDQPHAIIYTNDGMTLLIGDKLSLPSEYDGLKKLKIKIDPELDKAFAAPPPIRLAPVTPPGSTN